MSMLPTAQAQSAVSPPPEERSAQPLIMAAGSLTQAMNEIIGAYLAQAGKQSAARFVTQYGPSGKLRTEIEAGKQADVFASASMEHVEALAGKKLLGEPRVFTHNNLCVIARPALALKEDNLLDVLVRPDVRLATSTPVSDPMGDYTWQFFRNADARRPGLFARLEAKALKLSGTAAVAPGAKPPYVTAFEDDKADAYIMYCTNAVGTRKSLPELSIVPIPENLNIHGAYGIAARPDSAEGKRFVEFIMQPAAQGILRKYGFQ